MTRVNKVSLLVLTKNVISLTEYNMGKKMVTIDPSMRSNFDLVYSDVSDKYLYDRHYIGNITHKQFTEKHKGFTVIAYGGGIKGQTVISHRIYINTY